MRYGRTMEALAVYQKVNLMMETSEELVTNEFRGNVSHNMGVAFARLANDEAALVCFKKAYRLNRSTASLDAWLLTLKMLGRDEEMLGEAGRMVLAPEAMDRIEQKFNDCLLYTSDAADE